METHKYALKRSDRRVSRLRITVRHDKQVVVTAPRSMQKAMIDRVVFSKRNWITDKLAHFSSFTLLPYPHTDTDAYRRWREDARSLTVSIFEKYNEHYAFSLNGIRIKNHKRKWGSCSSRGNININYRIVFLPERLREYLVVHEMCHLKYGNHTARFWNAVSETVPDCRLLDAELKKIIF